MVYFDAAKAGYSSDYMNIDKVTFDKLLEAMPILAEGIPADLFLQDIIPLTDLTLNFMFDEDPVPVLVYVLDKDEAKELDYGIKAMGVMVVNDEIGNLICCNMKESLLFVLPDPGLKNQEYNLVVLNKMLAFWYRIQLLLLHPRAEVIERKAIKEKTSW